MLTTLVLRTDFFCIVILLCGELFVDAGLVKYITGD
jgi:hypothetical protein